MKRYLRAIATSLSSIGLKRIQWGVPICSEGVAMSIAHASVVAQRVPARLTVGLQELVQPAPIWALPPCPDGFTCEEIVIVSPTAGHTVSDPILVTGLASPTQDSLWAAVLDGSGGVIGVARCREMGANGQPNAFSATVEFTPPANSQPGRIQVWRESSSDGTIMHLTSVSVTVQGYDLELLLGQLEAAIAAKDYAAVRTTMADPFLFTVDATRPKTLSLEEATDLLRQQYLGPGAVRLDFSADPSAFHPGLHPRRAADHRRGLLDRLG